MFINKKTIVEFLVDIFAHPLSSSRLHANGPYHRSSSHSGNSSLTNSFPEVKDDQDAANKEKRIRHGRPAIPIPIPMPLATALLYGIIAVANNFIVKYALSLLAPPAVILLLQMLTTFFAVHILLFLGLDDFPSFSIHRWLQLLPLSATYLLHAGMVLRCLQVLNIPMYNTLKRLTPVFVLSAKSTLDRRLPPAWITGSVLMVVGGCTLACYADMDSGSDGYSLAVLCALLQAAYLLLVEASEAASSSPGEVMFYSSVTAIPLLMVMTFYDDSWLQAAVLLGLASQLKGSLVVAVMMVLCSFSEFALNGSLILCTAHNSGLTTSVVGVLKGVAAVVLGFFLLGGATFSALNVTGIAVAMGGGVLYVLVVRNMSGSGQRGGGAAAVRSASSGCLPM